MPFFRDKRWYLFFGKKDIIGSRKTMIDFWKSHEKYQV